MTASVRLALGVLAAAMIWHGPATAFAAEPSAGAAARLTAATSAPQSGGTLSKDNVASAAASSGAPAIAKEPAGHSSHGEAFNEGPRQKAYLMPGMGKVHFQVTTKQELAQKFFDQGVAQLHGFWYFEAERSFRQTAAIDPGCAMAYWGMAMANVNNEKRAKGFIAEAVKRKSEVTDRERKYIEGLDAFLRAGPENAKSRAEAYVKALEGIVCEHPDDIEAKAFLALQLWVNQNVGVPIASKVSVDAVLQQVLKVEPMHPCNHYRIHLWDGERPTQALDSAACCGQTSPGIAHMWHMPGHIYSALHRYAEAAWQQEASARVDHAHMIRDRVLPDQIHNFAHNNEWLIRNLANIGRVHDAVDLAKNMVELPRHPLYNTLTSGGSAYYGRHHLFEVLEKYELWDELIELCHSTYLEPTDVPAEQVLRLKYLGTAYIRQGDLASGEKQLAELKRRLAEQMAGKTKAVAAADLKSAQPVEPRPKQNDAKIDAKAVAAAKAAAAKPFDGQIADLDKAIALLEGHVAIHRGDYQEGFKLLTKAGAVDGMYFARLKGSLGSSDKVIIREIKAIGDAFVPNADSHVQVVVENTNDVPMQYIDIELTAGKENVVRQAIGKLDARQSRSVDFKFRFRRSQLVKLGASVVLAKGLSDAAAREFVTAHPGEVQPLASLVDLLWQTGKKKAALEQFKRLREISAAIDLDVPVFARLRGVAEELKLPADWRVKSALPSTPVPRPDLASLGPFRWHPSAAPSWRLADAAGKSHSLADYRGKPVVVIFYLGSACLHCARQLQAFAPKTKDFAAAGISLIAVSSDDELGLKISLANYKGGFPFPLVSDANLTTFKRYRAFDDFEDQPLHATFLIDPAGRVRWQDISYEPFMDPDFLLGEAKRLLAQDGGPVVRSPAIPSAVSGTSSAE